MDIKSFNKKLNKISALTDTGQDDLALSQLERDLILSYIRELYDIVLENSPSPVKIAEPKIEIQQPALKTEKPVVTEVPVVVIKPSPVQEIIEPVIQTLDKPASQLAEVLDVVVPIEKVVVPEVVHSVSAHKLKDAINPEVLAELFAEDKVTDLSDKLALSPVKDLTKSMGINERIFTQQELFGNSQQQFTDILQRLNNCQNFDEAKQYLIENVISTYSWTNENRIKKAATFIKLVKRKFS